MRFIFEVTVKPGHTEAEYVDAWRKGSEIIQKEPGAHGTKLHRKIGSPGKFVAIASWESKEARDQAMDTLSHAAPEIQEALDFPKQIAELNYIGSFDEPEWAVYP